MAERRITFDLYVNGEQRVAAAFSNVRQSAEKTERATRGVNRAWSAARTSGLAVAGAAGVAGGALLGVATAAVKMSDGVVGLNLQVGKARTVFGSSFGAVDASLRRTASQFGITRVEGLGMAAMIGDFARQAGYTTDRAAKLGVQFVELAGRVKFLSAGQMDSAAASDSLAAAFRGEYDSLQRVVPAISDARVQQVALDIQRQSSTRISSEQARMLAVMKIVQDGTRTSSALMATEEGKKALAIEEARTKMRGQWQELQARLLPALSGMWTAVADRVNPALEDFTAWLSSPEGKRGMKDLTNGVVGATSAMASFVSGIDDAIYWTKRINIEVKRAWADIGRSVREAAVETYSAFADLPVIGKGFEDNEKRARAALNKMQTKVDSFDTEISRLEVQRLQGKINSLKGKVVDAKTSPAAKRAAEREIRELQGKINGMKGKTLPLSVDAARAYQATVTFKDRMNNALDRIRDEEVRFTARGFMLQQGRVRPVATGGPIGEGRGTVDEVPLLGMRGEHMWTTRETDAVGGHGAMFRLRQAALRGELKGMATGGPVGVNITARTPSVAALMRNIDHAVGIAGNRLGALLYKAFGAMGGGNVNGWRNMWAAVDRAFPGANLHSGFRPGAITATGNRSYHGMGRAIDVTPSMAIFNWIASRYGRNTKELIFSPAGGRQIHNGRPHMYSGITRAMHWDHVHWAMDQGGLARGPGVFVKATSKPERVLSPVQTAAFEKLVPVLSRSGGGGGVTINLTLENHGVIASRMEARTWLADGLRDLSGTGHLRNIIRDS